MPDCFHTALTEKLPNLRRFALSLCRTAHVADDLVQITVERALVARNSYDPASRIESWLFRILKNAWIDMTRKQKVRGQELDIHDEPDLAGQDNHKGDTRLMVANVLEAVEKLPLEQREVVVLVCFEELSYAEAADILEIPKGTIMSRLSRARTAIAAKTGIK
ncbi:RNA polymerase sigma factor [uncultured Roseibium sp.]|uniref:RNA polymerase sigma factor n=1 Tax=uncultured Roseibium sp. TaxID=1936171 RepID=UPI00262615ED|nr:RNA polymerase sigma factor [uncultured Roseibium sp.]